MTGNNIGRVMDKYFGVSKGSTKREQRLRELPQYKVVDLRIGGMLVVHRSAANERTFTTEATRKALEERGIGVDYGG